MNEDFQYNMRSSYHNKYEGSYKHSDNNRSTGNSHYKNYQNKSSNGRYGTTKYKKKNYRNEAMPSDQIVLAFSEILADVKNFLEEHNKSQKRMADAMERRIKTEERLSDSVHNVVNTIGKIVKNKKAAIDNIAIANLLKEGSEACIAEPVEDLDLINDYILEQECVS